MTSGFKVIDDFISPGEYILGVYDLDQDGISEILIGGAEYHQGIWPHAELVKISNNKLVSVFKPNDVTYESAIYYLTSSKGQMPRLYVRNVQGDIDPSSASEKKTNAEKLDKPAESVTANEISPSQPVKITVPPGATAICRDGTYSYSQSRRGTCSHHGGVRQWLY
ncbi:MAG: DUF3761 domain-containing protein [Acidobacteriota bacterium]